MMARRQTRPRRPDAERGGVSIIVASVLALIAVSVTAVIASSNLLVERHALAGAADAAALAGADAASGLRAGDPCAVSEALASVVGARLDACIRDGADVTVRVLRASGPLTLHASATAGQPSRPSVDSKH